MGQWIIPPAMRPQAVVFDMDGLMVDTERVIKYTWDVTGERMGYKNFGDNILHTLGKTGIREMNISVKPTGRIFHCRIFWTATIRYTPSMRRNMEFPKRKD